MSYSNRELEDNDNPRVLIVGSLEGRGLALRSLLRSFRITNLSRVPSDPSLSFISDDVIYGNPFSFEESLESLSAYNNTKEIEGVISFSEHSAPIAARLAQALGLIGCDPEVAHILKNKHLTRRVLSDLGFSMPRWQVAINVDEAIQAVELVKLPCVVKPVDYAASLGVRKVGNKREVKEAALGALNVSPSKQIIVEEYVDGPEYYVDSLSYKGSTEVICISDKYGQNGPYFAELGHTSPTQLSGDIAENIVKYTVKLHRALNINNIATHTEVRLSNGEPVLIEINGRVGGDGIAETIFLATGVNLYTAIANISLGRQPEIQPSKARASTAREITALPGRVIEISGIENFVNPRIRDVYLNVAVGNLVSPLCSNFDTLGRFIVDGETPAETENLSQEFLNELVIQTI